MNMGYDDEVVEFSPRDLMVAIGKRRIVGDVARLGAMMLMDVAPGLIQHLGTPDNLVRVIRDSYETGGLVAVIEHAPSIVDTYHAAGYVAPFTGRVTR
jgi:hypothetical protein